MKIKKEYALLSIFSLAALLFFLACQISDENGRTMTVIIDKNNDSLLTFDSLVVKVYSKDSSFVQEVFHGKLTDPNQVAALPLDSRVGMEYKVSIIGYKGGKIGMIKEILVFGPGNFQSKDLSIQPGNDTTKKEPAIPEILAPADTSVAEGDSLRFRIGVVNPWGGATKLFLKDSLPGASLDTAGRNPGDGYFTWRPSFNQGRSEPYGVTFVYTSSGGKVERTVAVKVLNKNRPPKLRSISDQKAKENEAVSFKVEADDPDSDSLILTALDLPVGSSFSSGSFTWKPMLGQSGNYSIKFKVSDGRDSDWIAALLTVGNVDAPPTLEIKITSPAHDTVVNFTPIAIVYLVNGASLQKKISLKDGKNKIFIDSTIAGRTAMDTITITLDTVPPNKPSVIGASPVRTRMPTWTWKSGGGGVGLYRLRLDNENGAPSAVSPDTFFTPTKNLDVGIHALFVQEVDAAGNWSPNGKTSIRIDTTRPAPPNFSLGTASPTVNTQPKWNWTGLGDDVTGLFRYKLDDSDFGNGATETRETTFTPSKANALKEGVHFLYVQQQDSAGNWSNANSASVRVDLSPPSAPNFSILPLSPLNSLKPIWSWESGGGGGIGIYRCRLDDSGSAAKDTIVNGKQYMPLGNLTETNHTLFVQERDSAGNWSPFAYKTTELSVRGYVGNAGFSPGSAEYLSMALNSSGAPYIAFKDKANAGKISAMRLNASGRAWEMIGDAGFSPGEVQNISLSISGSGVPYVSFQDAANGDRVTVMRLNASGSAWELVGAAGFSPGTATNPSLALSSKGIPYVAFRDGANEDKATVMCLNATKTGWEIVGAAGFSSGVAALTSLAMSNADIPYVGFQDVANEYKATVMRFSGTAWENVGSAAFSEGVVYSLSLALSASGVPYVSFIDIANGSKATVMKFNGSKTAWETVGTAGFSSGRANYLSLALSNMSVPHVAFMDGSNGYKATVFRLNAKGTAWEPFTGVGFSPSGSEATHSFSLVVTSSGVPYVAFTDEANGYKVTVLKESFDP
jgi:hypothetical protein